MGRPKRIQFAGACYYVLLQGNNRQDIFMSNQDRRTFLALLRSYKERYGLKVYSYCLMPHEAHVLLETSEANLAFVMQGFNTVYTKYFNSAHNTVGHVFQGRYRALLVDKEHYLSEMTRYVHLHPVRAGMKERPWRYQWSSCSAYVEGGQSEPLVDTDEVLAQFGKNRLKQSVRYLHYIQDRMKSTADLVLPIVRGVAVGSEAFLSRVEENLGEAPVPRATAGVEARRILSEVAVKHGMDEERLLSRVQWREVTTVRRKAIYRIWKETRLGVTELGRLFNRTPSAVSQLIRAMETPARVN